MPKFLINGEFIEAPSELEACLEVNRRRYAKANPPAPPLIVQQPDPRIYAGNRYETAEQAAWAQALHETTIAITQPNSTRTSEKSIVTSGGKTVIPIPLQLPNAWAVPTGTVSRATFAVSTVTTAQLAARVAALIQDLQSTGQAPTST